MCMPKIQYSVIRSQILRAPRSKFRYSKNTPSVHPVDALMYVRVLNRNTHTHTQLYKSI